MCQSGVSARCVKAIGPRPDDGREALIHGLHVKTDLAVSISLGQESLAGEIDYTGIGAGAGTRGKSTVKMHPFPGRLRE